MKQIFIPRSDFVLCIYPWGWYLYPPYTTESQIMSGDVKALMKGHSTRCPTHSDYVDAVRHLYPEAERIFSVADGYWVFGSAEDYRAWRRKTSEVAVKATKRWTDPETGKKRQQTKKFWQTISPFNKNEDGSVKTREQILNEIKAKRDAWLAS